MGCTFNNSVLHGEMNKSSHESHYFCLHPFSFPCPPSCRREFVGSSGCCSAGSGVWDVCDCAQEGQLEVSFVFFFPSDFSLCVVPRWPHSSLHLFISLYVLFVCVFFFVCTSLSAAASQTCFYGCVGRLTQCDTGLGCTARDESLLFIVYLCTPSFGDSFTRGQLFPLIPYISARIKIA